MLCRTHGVEGQMVMGEGYLWVTQTGFPLTRIDIASESVAQQFNGEPAAGRLRFRPARFGFRMWKAGAVLRIDPKRVHGNASRNRS